MDDYLEWSPYVEEASNKDLVKILARRGFKLTKFVSNVSQPPTDFEADLTSNREKAKPGADECSHVLVLKWIYSSQTVVVSWGTCPGTTEKITQTVVLTLVSAMYDPIGFVGP